MALTPYCENAEVRAALGVNSIELPDAVLNLPIYQIGLVRELNKVASSLPASFSAANAKPSDQRTEAEKALLDATKLFSAYASARQVGVSLASMMPKDVGDGKATVSRFADAPYKDTLARLEAMYLAARSSLLASLAELNQTDIATAVTPIAFIAGKRSYDPVTG
ncbi:hypothetical protein H4CHR_02975 [Variovorax sp. PBS-H4]|uniref:hypothetical protein n=1 Tax=Variovorax sp. PBS-H4 TaxID=434008 RepID=UPI00131841F0|nr:hypothetical protein [Variovorax sp. PBS-H4]VTU32254.1 hypothetical protein H4CHR_02975 [Variovorax sp. PBS-H4]